MSKRIRWIMPLALLIAAGAGLPGQARAAICVDGYNKCLNDTWDTSGWQRLLADVECFAEYVGCVRRKV